MDPMRIVYLTGEHLYLRPLVAADKERAAAWHPGPFFIDRTQAEKRLKEGGDRFTQRLALVRSQDDEAVGSVELQGRDSWRRCAVSLHIAPTVPDGDALRAEASRLVVPWLRDRVEVMVVQVETASDQPETIAALEGMGMRLAVRFREAEARPGGRVDGLRYGLLSRGPAQVGGREERPLHRRNRLRREAGGVADGPGGMARGAIHPIVFVTSPELASFAMSVKQARD